MLLFMTRTAAGRVTVYITRLDKDSRHTKIVAVVVVVVAVVSPTRDPKAKKETYQHLLTVSISSQTYRKCYLKTASHLYG